MASSAIQKRNRWGRARRIGFERELGRHAISVASFTPAQSSLRLIDRDRFRSWLKASRAYIDAHATECLTPAQLATRLHVSRPLLDLRFRELKQGTVANAIRTRQLAEVSRLLQETDYTTRQIGQLCGFQNERSLKNIFKRVYGTTMTDYRANPPKTSCL